MNVCKVCVHSQQQITNSVFFNKFTVHVHSIKYKFISNQGTKDRKNVTRIGSKVFPNPPKNLGSGRLSVVGDMSKHEKKILPGIPPTFLQTVWTQEQDLAGISCLPFIPAIPARNSRKIQFPAICRIFLPAGICS